MCKSDLRQQLITIRQDYVKSLEFAWHEGREWPADLQSLLTAARCVGGYIAVRSEANLTSLLRDVAALGTPIALPFLATREAAMEFRHYEKDGVLGKAPFGFRQPSQSAAIAHPDVILTPLLGFDRAGNRLGQGGGHYDRFFEAFPQALRIGVAWSVEEVSAIAVDPWDVSLDAVITEKEWIIPSNSRIAPK